MTNGRSMQIRRTAAACMLLCLFSAGMARGQAPAFDVTSERVAKAIDQALPILKTHLTNARAGRGNFNSDGQIALAVLALLNAGVGTDDKDVAAGLKAVEAIPNQWTYSTSLKVQVLSAADAKKYARQIQDAADWLSKTQSASGAWGYGGGQMAAGRPDNSNTQFALLGLHEAAKAGAKIAPEVWTKSQRYFTNTQQKDGGWSYVYMEGARLGRLGDSYGSMTVAGLSSLYICGMRLNVGGAKSFVNGAYPDCGKYLQNKVLADGLNWMATNFSATENPKHSGAWLNYYLYGMERVGMISGMRAFGPHDWYREGAATLLAGQGLDGSWGGQGSIYDTAMAVLFLAKGNRPVLIQKVEWNEKDSKPGQWNRNLHDLENLTNFIGDRLGKPTTWQTTSLAATVKDLRQSPILLITGHTFPVFTDEERQKLRQFVDSGGTLVFEACCGSEPFRKGFRAFAKEEWPEYQMHVLGADHPVYDSLFDLKNDTYDLEGLEVGCRTSVFFSPNALDCLWELQTIPKMSDKALRLGANLAAYATGREQLNNKLDVVDLPEAAKAATQPAEVPRGAVRIARLKHDGDYNADPHALVNLAAMLRDKTRMDVVAHERHISATDEKIFEYPVIFMTGHYTFKFSDKEVAALRKYLDRGGFLIADACCGQKAFDTSFRELVKQLYPDKEFAPLPADHPIYTGKVGVQLGELKYRQLLAKEINSRGTTRPPLEALTVDKRTVILYSKYDFSCGLEGDNPFSSRGYVDADGQKLALDLFLYAISY